MQQKAPLLLILAIAAPFGCSFVACAADVSNPGQQWQDTSTQRSKSRQSRHLAAGSARADVSDASSHRSRDLSQFTGTINGTSCSTAGFPLVEATISQAHAALLYGRLNCSDLIKVHRSQYTLLSTAEASRALPRLGVQRMLGPGSTHAGLRPCIHTCCTSQILMRHEAGRKYDG